jgi:uncharacterized membrane protein (UPF0182 family)
VRYEIPTRTKPRRLRPAILIIFAVLVLASARFIGKYAIEYQWWREMGQVPTWIDMLVYSFTPLAAAVLVAFAVLFTAHARALKFSGTRLGYYPTYARVSTLVLLLLAVAISAAAIDTWTVVRYFGSRQLPAEATVWQDPVFGQPLLFYLFSLPFYSSLLGYVLALTIVATVLYWVAARVWQVRDRFAEFRQTGEIDFRVLRLEGALESKFLRAIGAALLVALAVRYFLGRYEMLWTDHGFMVGVNYVDENIRLPLQWALMATCVVAAGFLLAGRWKWLLIVPAVLLLRAIVPAVVTSVYVRPNEISIERPYIARHIGATRAAFALENRVRAIDFNAQLESRFDPGQQEAILNNVRLWDWQAFHDTVMQIQALRPYYTFADSDVDRYTINGKLTQTLLSPRDLDIRQLPEAARGRWINPHFIYTHGYGVVMAEANRITPNGLPVLFVQNAPPDIRANELKLTRPELYYSETTHEPVFVHTAQPEFSYPSGSENVFAKYEGRGGFPVSSLPMRIAAALAQADANILLTQYLTPESRMMIRRNIHDRLESLAGFLTWDPDPYLVITGDGRLVWTVDGYTTSRAHPYSHIVNLTGIGNVNYMRNAVKATIDAYDGTTHIYIFDPSDPIIRAYQRLFPQLFQPFERMPDDLRAHARYPELYFRVQAEVYRTYHMLDAQAFYNREDLWDIARTVRGQQGRAEPMTPTYVVAALPGETRPEFLLIIPFTPRNKDNLIGLMVARCDGENLGELMVLQLSKQELMYGPMQIEARINQDQLISKDLNLWNQQGSQVLRGQMLVLPIADTFVYVEPIYIQASEARMPQLKKVVVAMGNQLFYTDTYEQALDQLSAYMKGQPPPKATAAPEPGQPAAQPAAPVPAVTTLEQRLDTIRRHLQRYRDLAAQGRWAEAGKELEAVEQEVRR